MGENKAKNSGNEIYNTENEYYDLNAEYLKISDSNADPKSNKEIGKRFRFVRQKMDLSQTEMGAVMDMHPSTISLIENGQRPLRKDYHTEKLEMYQKRSVNLDWIFKGVGQPFLSLEDQLLRINFGEDDFIRDFIMVYLHLDDFKKTVIREMVERLFGARIAALKKQKAEEENK